MKKRVYFIVASSITFLMSILSLIMSNELVKATIKSIREMYGSFPQSFQDRVIGIYEKSGGKLIIFSSILLIIGSLLLFKFAIKNTLLKHKGLVITICVITFLFSSYLLTELLAIASFIVILCCKRKNPEDFPEKKKVYKLQLGKCYLMDYLLSIILLLAYFSQFIWSKYLPDDFVTSFAIEILFNIIMILSCILVFFDQLKFNFKIFKANFIAYIKYILPRLGITYIFLIAASLISLLITKNAVSVNQQAVESLPLYYLLPSAIIYAPIVEEIIFRGVIRRFIKNDIIFIIVSAISFGILHTIGESSITNIIIMSLPYTVLGAFLSYVYVKTNNIFSNIAGHAIFNTISSIFMIFM